MLYVDKCVRARVCACVCVTVTVRVCCVCLWQMSNFGGLSFAITNKTTYRGVFTMDLSSGGANMVRLSCVSVSACVCGGLVGRCVLMRVSVSVRGAARGCVCICVLRGAREYSFCVIIGGCVYANKVTCKAGLCVCLIFSVC